MDFKLVKEEPQTEVEIVIQKPLKTTCDWCNESDKDGFKNKEAYGTLCFDCLEKLYNIMASPA